jgi:hypothetical protein
VPVFQSRGLNLAPRRCLVACVGRLSRACRVAKGALSRMYVVLPPSHILLRFITHKTGHEKYNEKYESTKDTLVLVHAKFQVDQKFV